MRRIWTVVLAAAMAVSFVGCDDSGTAETQTVEQVSEATVSSDEEKRLATEPMTKNELLEEMLCDVEINGQKLSLPCSSKDLCSNDDLEIEPYKECPVYYDDDDNMYHYIFGIPLSADMYINVVYRSDKSNETELSADKMYSFFISSSLKGFNENYTFRFGQINNYSNMTQEDVEKLLGNSDKELYATSTYELDNSRIITIHYDKNSYVKSVSCHWL